MPAWSLPEARAIVESLRYGTPPVGHVRDFTVGRELQLRQLEKTIANPSDRTGSALLVRANYGAGKSHLLRIVRERALEAGYAVALVVTDAVGGVRFNRMDTIFGAVSREVEIPMVDTKGTAALFGRFAHQVSSAGAHDPTIRRLTAGGRWSPTGDLCDPLEIGIRAWVLGSTAQRSLVEEWFAWPEPFRSRRRDLYYGLCGDLEHRFADPRSEADYYIGQSFWFHTDGHRNAWLGIRDLHRIAVAAGLRGLVLLFDEFEDVIQNLNNRSYQVAAFANLFRYFKGDGYPGMAYFAVTPDFAERCKEELLGRGVYDFPFREFTKLPAFELSPIRFEDFQRLTLKIAEAHGVAYSWDPLPMTRLLGWGEEERAAWGRPAPDRIRQAIQRIVAHLDTVRSTTGPAASRSPA